MFDDFFLRAVFGCIGIALAAGPLGCVVVWRRMAYFGDTMAHSALLGVALALISHINITVAVFIVTLLIAVILLLLEQRPSLSSDSLLGVLSHSSLAVSLVILSFMPSVRQDLTAYLFGDALSVSKLDLALIWGGGIAVLITLRFLWRSLLAATISNDLAAAEGLRPERAKVIFMLLLAVVIAIVMKIVGILLITALLIIPAATARRFAKTPEGMALLSALIGVLAVITGLYSSLFYNTPSGPSVVVGAFIFFIISLLPLKRFFSRKG